MRQHKQENRNEGKPKGIGRFRFFIIITALFLGILLWKYISLMLIHPKPEQTSTLTRPIVERGPILDRNGKILAIQTKLSSITAWIPHIDDISGTAELLASELNLDQEELRTRLEENSGFIYIKRKVSPSQADKIAAYIDAGSLPGISLEPEYGRNYPEKNLASHLIGYAGTDNVGLSGIEYSLNHELSPDAGESEQEVVYGNQVFLTIDLNVQHFADQLAEEAYEEHEADAVTVMIMEAKTGDIIASVSKPDFDLNRFSAYTREERENRPFTVAYEPGSVFKIFSMASILDLGGVTPDDHFYCDGAYHIDIPGQSDDEIIHDLRPHGDVTPQKIIQYSCNVGIGYASESVGSEAFYNQLKKFGFGTPTGLPVPGETAGQLRPPSSWSIRSKPTIAFGQELSVSAIQVATAGTALANNGVLLRPRIIHKIVGSDGQVIENFTREPQGEVISAETARQLLLMMETATFPGGTAQNLYMDGFRISAKTGTGQMLDRETGKYSEDAYTASAYAIFPTDDPTYIVYVVIDYPKGDLYYGSRIAVPVVRDIIEELVSYYRLPREGDIIVHHPGKIEVREGRKLDLKQGDPIPDLTGYSKREILPLFNVEGVTIFIRGEGWVKSQDPAPGTALTEGTVVTLEME